MNYDPTDDPKPKRSGYFNIQFTDEYRAKIKAVKSRCNFRTLQDTIIRLVNIGLFVAKAQEDGMKIFVEDDEGNRMGVHLI